ncbi:MAG: hypothetical protein IJL54_00995 [Prevotella sp.]|nr:hypothetical protein [Prevotella sp.]
MKNIIFFILLYLMLSVLASCTDNEAMRQRLSYVSQCNRADTVFTEAWLPTVDSLVSYFDRHGNANEKMMAHYLKGRVHHDMGESPIALECYQKATEMADTTKKDCDLRTLTAIYGQMADLFHLQYLPDDEMAATMASEQIAWRNKDTLNALISFSLRTKPYYLLNDTDSVLSIAKQACLLFAKHGYVKNAALTYRAPISIYLDRNQFAEASRAMKIYERESGLFDENGEIARGRELYYYDKGRYLLYEGKLDSAINCFRRTIKAGKLEGGYKGLMFAFEKKHMKDSVVKYSCLFANANDASYINVEQELMHVTASMYDFSRQQQLAEKNIMRAREAMQYVAILILVLAVMILTFIIFHSRFRHYRQMKDKELAFLNTNLDFSIAEYEKWQHNYDILKVSFDNLTERLKAREKEGIETGRMLKEYKETLGNMEKELNGKELLINNYEEQLRNLLAGKGEDALQASGIVKRMKGMSFPSKGTPIPEKKDWEELASVFNNNLPKFYRTISTGQLSQQEFRTCMLVRLNFSTSEIANLLETSPSRIAKVKSLANEKLFNYTDAYSLYKNLLQT